MIKAIVLDIGGVLLRTEDRSGRQDLEKKYNLPSGAVDALVFKSEAAAESTLGRVRPEKIWQDLAEDLSLSPDALIKFQEAFWEGDRIDLELLDYLQSQRSDYQTALLTNAWVDARESLAEQYQIIEGVSVDHILISSELGVAKPDQRIYHILADTIRCDFEQILFVDDFIENIEAAEALGMHTIHYQPGVDLINRIQSKVIQY